MGQTDKQFCGFLRFIIRYLQKIRAEQDTTKKQALIDELLTDLQNTLED